MVYLQHIPVTHSLRKPLTKMLNSMWSIWAIYFIFEDMTSYKNAIMWLTLVTLPLFSRSHGVQVGYKLHVSTMGLAELVIFHLNDLVFKMLWMIYPWYLWPDWAALQCNHNARYMMFVTTCSSLIHVVIALLWYNSLIQQQPWWKPAYYVEIGANCILH